MEQETWANGEWGWGKFVLVWLVPSQEPALAPWPASPPRFPGRSSYAYTGGWGDGEPQAAEA